MQVDSVTWISGMWQDDVLARTFWSSRQNSKRKYIYSIYTVIDQE